MGFFPKKSEALSLLKELTEQMERAAQLFYEAKWGSSTNVFADLAELEHKADTVVYKLNTELARVFIHPLDREDIKKLCELFDDIIDHIEEAANRLKIFQIPTDSNQFVPALKQFGELILKTAKYINKGLELIQKRQHRKKEFEDCYHAIHTIENEGDKLHHEILRQLMNDEKLNYMYIIKWTIVFQILENAIDKGEDVAVAYEGIRIKYS